MARHRKIPTVIGTTGRPSKFDPRLAITVHAQNKNAMRARSQNVNQQCANYRNSMEHGKSYTPVPDALTSSHQQLASLIGFPLPALVDRSPHRSNHGILTRVG